MDLPTVHPVVVGHMIEEQRRELSVRDTAGAALLEEFANSMTWEDTQAAWAAGFEAFLTIEELEELTGFLDTDVGRRFKARLPDLLLAYVQNKPGAEGREQMERALSPFTDAERAQMDRLLNGQGLTNLGMATFSAYARSVLHDRSRYTQGAVRYEYLVSAAVLSINPMLKLTLPLQSQGAL